MSDVTRKKAVATAEATLAILTPIYVRHEKPETENNTTTFHYSSIAARFSDVLFGNVPPFIDSHRHDERDVAGKIRLIMRKFVNYFPIFFILVEKYLPKF